MIKLDKDFSVRGHTIMSSVPSEKIKMDANRNQKDFRGKGKGVRKVSSSLLAHEVKDYEREPFITSGYRDTENITVRQCLATLFSIHNETVNIWSHLFATLGFLLYFGWIFSGLEIVGNPRIYPLLCFACAICLVFFSSAFAHLFCCMSWKARHTCFYIDYATISIFTFAAGQVNFFYCRPLGQNASDLHTFPYIFLGISVSFACLNMSLSCLSRHRFIKYRFLLRTGMYLFKFIFDISPYLARCTFGLESSCSSTTSYLFNRHIFCFALSGVTNAFRIPERWYPGLFDFFGHSHHFLHIMTILGNYDAFTIAYIDMIERANDLAASPYQPTFFWTFGLFILLTCANAYIGVWFVSTWLRVEEEELMVGSKYMVIYKKESSYENGLDHQTLNSSTRKKEN